MAGCREDWVEVLIEAVPGTVRCVHLRTGDPARAAALLGDMAALCRLRWWASRPPAAQTVTDLVAAVNRGDWRRAWELVPPTGRLIVDDGRRRVGYELRALVGVAERALAEHDADVICCASLASGRLGVEIVAHTDGRRLEVAAEGRVEGPLGRLENVVLEVGPESPLAVFLGRLAGAGAGRG